MIFRTIATATIVVFCMIGIADAAPEETPASSDLGQSVPPVDANLVSYRLYAKTQADMLVGMTKVLANEIKRGDLDAARSAYAPAHRFFERIRPIAKVARNLHRRMNASADAYGRKEVDPQFGGFHRIEYGLFANRSTAGLSAYADQLQKDARDLRERVATLDVQTAILADDAIENLEDIATKSLTGDEERYSRTDLWDFEANIEGVQQIVVMLHPTASPENADILERTKSHFAKINDLLAKHKAGCGFENYDEVGRDDKIALKASMAALAEALSTLRPSLASN